MYYNGQTLVSKDRKRLVRLKVNVHGGLYAWNIGEHTIFVDEKGKEFTDNIKNYECIRDEFGRAYSPLVKEGEFVGEDAKKYLVSDAKLMKMREDGLKMREAFILLRMAGLALESCDVSGKRVHCPFTDGGRCYLFRDFFLRERNAVPLYEKWDSIGDGFVNGPMVFKHTDGQTWLYNDHLSELVVIQNIFHLD